VLCLRTKERVTMDLKNISDADLLRDTKHYAREEKENGIKVLHHIKEVDARKLFLPKYSSLYKYCIEELNYSETSAGRRIQTMRLIRDLPEYADKLQEGVVHESNLSTVQTFFNLEAKKLKKKYSKEEKLKVLKAVEGKSARQTQQVLATISPQSARKENTKPINTEETEIRFTASRALMEKFEKIRNLLGHQLSDQQYASLFEELADLAIRKLEPQPKKEKSAPPTSEPIKKEETVSETRYIPAKVKRAVWARDQGQCSYVGPDGLRCDSKYALQYEHVIPFGKRGKSTFENLKLLCVSHNQFSAIQAYGLPKMQEFWAK
jgi:hypothetical protein